MAKVGKFCLAKRVKVEWLFQTACPIGNYRFHYFINNVSSLTFQITMRSKPCFEKLKLYCIDSLFTDAEIISYIGNCRFNFSFIQSFNYILETIRERIQTLSSRSNIHQNLFAKFSQVIWQGFDFSQ
ncbi:Uncharacterised protein [Bacteroides thetaiotaomicron]|uniref:Uncharacterized protein n=1 Tax=Bacteroides thetaiotaomicron TaxID=818 RepID=A0A174SAQ6_BACT4|nr:Uncharacterised protein [Bacteroides thetaiotaomicron]